MSDQATGEQPDAPPRRSATPPRRRLRHILIAVAALLVVALAAGGVYLYSIDKSLTKNITRADTLPEESPTVGGDSKNGGGVVVPRPTRDPDVRGALNYVLLGSDSRDPDAAGNGRSDSIMVVHLNDKRDKAYITSFPRDMYVDIPGYGKNKINAAFAFGGPKLTVTTLEDMLGVRMDHVVLVDFEGFIQLTEDLGGVEIKNTHAFTSHGFDYPKGEITIRGQQALWFVRERYSLPGGDLDRAANQRKVIKAIVSKGLSKTTIADPVRYLNFVTGLAKHLTVDSSLSDSELRKTARSINLSGDDVELLQAPISGFGTTPGGESIDIVDQTKLKELGTALKKDKLDDYLKKNPEN